MLHLMNATFKDFKKQISLNPLRDICLQNYSPLTVSQRGIALINYNK